MSTRHRAKTLVGRPSVSVVIPHYNYGRYLPVALESVLSQDDVDVEVIIVDDASTDGSLDVARTLASSDPRVKLIEHGQNMRHIATYNDGLARATAEFVVLLSADDALAPGALGRAAALFQAEPDVSLVYGRADEFDSELPPASTLPVSWTTWGGEEWLRLMCRRGRNIIVNPEAMIRRDVLEQLGGYDAALPHSADMYMWMRAAARGRVGRVNGPTQAFYRQHGANMHSTEFGGKLDDLSATRETFQKLFLEDSARLSAPARLRATAERAVAREALRMSVHEEGEAAASHRASLIDFAAATGASGWSRTYYSVAPKVGLSPVLRQVESLRWSLRYRRHRKRGI